MSCTLEWIAARVAILRLHPIPAAKLGDDYVWWTVIKLHGWGLAEIKGADKPLPPGGAKAVCAALKAAGFTKRVHARRNGDQIRMVEKEL